MVKYIIRGDENMIKSIKSIQNLGIYKNYKMENKLQLFSKFNLLYGWNGSGKTTISRLFRIIEKGEIPNDYINIKFNIETESQNYNEKNYTNISEKIFVFNEEFINENINWDESINKILLLSEDKINETNQYKIIKEEINGNVETNTKGLKDIFLQEKEKLAKEYKNIEDSYSRIAKNIKTFFQTMDPSDREYSTLNKIKIQNILENNSKLEVIMNDNQTETDIEGLIISAKNEKKN